MIGCEVAHEGMNSLSGEGLVVTDEHALGVTLTDGSIVGIDGVEDELDLCWDSSLEITCKVVWDNDGGVGTAAGDGVLHRLLVPEVSAEAKAFALGKFCDQLSALWSSAFVEYGKTQI